MAYHGLSQHVELDRVADPLDRFTLEGLIGEGTYGEVFSARDKKSKRRVAIKILENIPENIEEIEEEFLVFRDLSHHPNLPTFHGLFLKRGQTVEDDQLWFVMELCTGGSVTDLVQGLRNRGDRLTDEQIAYILRETVQALIYLHGNHCMHRDVKGHNILLTENAEIKLVDFGVSSHLAATMARRNTSVGTPYWMAPEVIACEQQLDHSYDARCDVWSIGITAIELAEGDPPLSDLHPMRALFQIPRNPPPSLSHPESHTPLLSDFLSECLVKDLDQRPFIREILQHPLLTSVYQFADKVRKELQAEIVKQRAEGRGFRKPDATTKRGKLKSHRKARPEKMYMDDLAVLDELTEDAIVEQLLTRYNRNQIYTYIGDILVAVNPFTDLGIYGSEEQERYCCASRSDNPPHIFAAADAAHQSLLHQRKHQAIVISGESGAGKTESANLLLKQLVYLAKAPNRNLEDRILQVNPIMEAFGNARTGINANSSRFGKYLDLTMTRAGKVTGARISVYLLEQSRVVHQAVGESNFHLFYYLYDGLESCGRASNFYLDSNIRSKHRYLRSLSPIHTQLNVDKWNQLNESFKLIGFQKDEVDTVYRMLAAILHLGDIEFGEVISQDNTDNKSRIIDSTPLQRVSRLLGVEASELKECLTCSSVVTRGETITRYNTLTESGAARDAMARGLYARLFDWIVNQINSLLSFNRPHCSEQLSIGLLDIFGFENFSSNSFEQLCINVANEQIQYYFNQHIFTWEQQEYMVEGIPVDLVEFSDNRPVLDMLLSRPMGLLALLDEESRFLRSNDRSLIEKFHNNIKSKYYVRPKSDAVCFAIHHFAGRVVYQASGFLEKNRNFLPHEIIQLMRQSQYDIVRFLFQCPITKTGNLYSALQTDSSESRKSSTPSSKSDTKEKYNSRGLASQSRAQQTVATYFRYSLMDLLQKMVSGTPQFVRCLKPNESRSPKLFDNSKILKQLRYTGVLETIRIRQNGFSHRLPFAEFLKRYSFLGFSYDEQVEPDRNTCRLLLIRLKLDGWALGKTKVFLKYYHVEYLAKMYEEQIKKIVLAQACVRRWIAMNRYKMIRWKMSKSVLTLQKHVRGWITRKQVKEKQKQLFKEREKEKERLRQIEIENRRMQKEIQSKQGFDGKGKSAFMKVKLLKRLSSQDMSDHSEKENLNSNKAAVIIQSHFRGYTVRRKWSDHLKDRRRPKKTPQLPIHDRQTQLEIFAKQIHNANQESHKIMRRNKPGIILEELKPLPDDYVPPPGFTIMSAITNQHDLSSHLRNEISPLSRFAEDRLADRQISSGWSNVPMIGPRARGSLVR
ncbi:myosin-IIIa-like isoform X2 [Arctopsyche grandis]|uniref:myosin-IIIa-like isoform X2 n=1 Tax=Arctopsyche grandis TaxID=121162 RepID=UPI00406D9A25